MKTIHNYNTSDAVNVLVKDAERGLNFEILEEGGAVWLTITDDDGDIVADASAKLPEEVR